MRGWHVLTAIRTTSSTVRMTIAAFLIALVGAVSLVAVPAVANATTPAPTGNLPGCVLPAGVHWQLTGTRTVFARILEQPSARYLVYVWGASANGHTYAGTVRYVNVPPDQAVANGYGVYTACSVS